MRFYHAVPLIYGMQIFSNSDYKIKTTINSKNVEDAKFNHDIMI